jgi:hypothetical protein
MSDLENIQSLIDDVLKIIPEVTKGRGHFNADPKLGYTAKNPYEWQKEFLNIFNPKYLDETIHFEIQELIKATNFNIYKEANIYIGNKINQQLFLSKDTIHTILVYSVFEMIIRRLTPVIDDQGYLINDIEIESRKKHMKANNRVSSLEDLLEIFELKTHYTQLAKDFNKLNSRMISKECDRNGKVKKLNLYKRITKGRNLMLHGNISHSTEGNVLVLLVDLIVLHLMKKKIS